jgi:hypothetical protein
LDAATETHGDEGTIGYTGLFSKDEQVKAIEAARQAAAEAVQESRSAHVAWVSHDGTDTGLTEALTTWAAATTP